jgi:hypothetical protein
MRKYLSKQPSRTRQSILKESAIRKTRGKAAKIQKVRQAAKRRASKIRESKQARLDKIKSEKMVRSLRKQKAAKDITKAQKQADRLAREIEGRNGQQLLQKPKNRPMSKNKVNSIKKDIQAIKKARTKSSTKQHYNKAVGKIKTSQRAILKLVRKAKPTLKLAQYTKLSTAIAIGLHNILNKVAQAKGLSPNERQGIIPISDQKDKQKTKRKTVQKPKEEEKTITVPEQGTRIDTKSKTQQLVFIASVLAPLAVSQAFRLRGRRINKKQTRLRGGLRKAVKYVYNRLKKKKRAYTPDVYSLVFGIKARPREKIKLLRKGRVFTGQEIRRIVR